MCDVPDRMIKPSILLDDVWMKNNALNVKIANITQT